jgi:hypothetical protein
MYDILFTKKDVDSEAQDVEWLTVELAHDSEGITSIQCELDQPKQNSYINENSRHEQTKNYYNSTQTMAIQNPTRTT